MPVHGAIARGLASARDRVLDGGWLGVLTWVIGPDVVDEAIRDGQARQVRVRSLPARLGVYFVLGLCLFSSEPYRAVLAEVTGGLETPLEEDGWSMPATTALSRMRARVGEKPLEALFRTLCSALSPGRSPWSHARGLLVVAVDGTTVSTGGSAANAAAFGRPGTGRKTKGKTGTAGEDDARQYPQLRLVALMACGTRALLDAAIGPGRGKGTGERALAAQLLASVRAGMLLLADRNFYSWQLWRAAAATGAHLLWRVQNSMHLPVIRELPDGSYLAHISDPAEVRRRAARNGARRRRGSRLPPQTGPLPGITVRVIEYTLTVTHDDGTTRPERFRHVTTILDWRAFPAAELAAVYAWRWAIETGYRECKTYLRGSGRLLRAATPDLARQELWALLAVYQALRTLIVRAAAGAGIDPDRISFTAALDTAQQTLAARRTRLTAALAAAEAGILSCRVPEREGRISPRAVNKPVAPYPSRHNHPGPISHHAGYTITITTADTSTQTTASQAQHHRNPENQPP